VAGRWVGRDDPGVLIIRRALAIDREPRGRGAVCDRLAERTAALFGSRAPLVDALVFAPRVELDAAVRERYARSGLAHILSISGLHVGFLAAWLALILAKLGLSPHARMAAAALSLCLYLWLIGLPPPAVRAVVMLVLADVARVRQRVVAPAGTLALAALLVVVVDPWAVQAVGA
jgi:competence protein ComEC